MSTVEVLSMREIMTPEQVAEYLQLNTDTVYRLIRGHQLAASKIGRTYRIPKEDVEAFLLSHSTRAQVREALFRRVAEIGERNAAQYPELTSDQVLDELEADDAKRRRPQTRGG
jgi:excisionase family DNA binding protein